MSSRDAKYYLPIHDPDVILEGCETLLRSLVQRIIEKHINEGRTAYTNETNVRRVRVTKIVIEFE